MTGLDTLDWSTGLDCWTKKCGDDPYHMRMRIRIKWSHTTALGTFLAQIEPRVAIF